MDNLNRPFIISGIEICKGQGTGITRYMVEIIKRLDALLVENKINIDIRICYPLERELIDLHLTKIKMIPLITRNKKWQTHVLRRYIKEENGIFIGMSNNLTLNKGSIVCLHDIRPLVTSKYDPLLRRLEYLLIGISIKKFACKVVTVSETQKQLITETLRINENKIEVIPNGWEHIVDIEFDEDIFQQNPQIIKGEYYYSLGSISLHKNYKWIIEVAKRNPKYTFVVAGGESLRKWSEEYTGNAKNIVYAGYVSDETNKTLMKYCKAFIHPSKFEGFGIPPLEALALGKEIVISNSSCLPEIYGDSAHYIDPNKYDVNLDLLVEAPVESSSTILKKFRWDNSAQKWLDLILKHSTQTK